MSRGLFTKTENLNALTNDAKKVSLAEASNGELCLFWYDEQPRQPRALRVIYLYPESLEAIAKRIKPNEET